jgi:hypothetical protein
MRLKLVACEVFYRELSAVVARSPNQVDLEFVPQGLHNLGAPTMRDRLQAVVDRTDPAVHAAILLGYGLCGNGLIGLMAPRVPLVVPREHDCLALFFGSRERYEKYFAANPRVYYKTSGWLERANSLDANQLSFGPPGKPAPTWEELVEKFGEEDAAYIRDTLSTHLTSYNQITYIDMGVEPVEELERRAKADADHNGWKYERIRGDLGLLQRLADGPWNDADFLSVPPGRQITAKYDGTIIGLDPA